MSASREVADACVLLAEPAISGGAQTADGPRPDTVMVGGVVAEPGRLGISPSSTAHCGLNVGLAP